MNGIQTQQDCPQRWPDEETALWKSEEGIPLTEWAVLFSRNISTLLFDKGLCEQLMVWHPVGTTIKKTPKKLN